MALDGIGGDWLVCKALEGVAMQQFNAQEGRLGLSLESRLGWGPRAIPLPLLTLKEGDSMALLSFPGPLYSLLPVMP